ncbi:MAG: hypothetical protein ABUM51_00750 [Bacteroidota bacterium]
MIFVIPFTALAHVIMITYLSDPNHMPHQKVSAVTGFGDYNHCIFSHNSSNYFQTSFVHCSFVSSKGSSSSDRTGKCKERKKRVMVVSFNWHNYSVAFSFLKKEAWLPKAQKILRPGQEKNLSEGDLFEAAERAKTAIVSGIRWQGIKKVEKWELIIYLRQLLKPYTGLRVPQANAFRIAINNVIERNVEEYCSICLTRQDLSLLWKGVG